MAKFGLKGFDGMKGHGPLPMKRGKAIESIWDQQVNLFEWTGGCI